MPPTFTPTGADVLDAAHAAELLGVSPGTLYELARTGKVRSFRCGRCVRFRRDWLVQFQEAGGTGGGRVAPAAGAGAGGHGPGISTD